MKQQRPATADEGKGQILTDSIKRFERGDGTGAEWALMVESLFQAAFEAINHLEPKDRARVLRRVHTGAYERLTAEDDGESKKDASGKGLALTNIAQKPIIAPRPKG